MDRWESVIRNYIRDSPHRIRESAENYAARIALHTYRTLHNEGILQARAAVEEYRRAAKEGSQLERTLTGIIEWIDRMLLDP